MSCFHIYIVVFAFLFSTVEKVRWLKLNEMVVFGIFFICYVLLLQRCSLNQRFWSHLLKKSVMENFIFCAVLVIYHSPMLTLR